HLGPALGEGAVQLFRMLRETEDVGRLLQQALLEQRFDVDAAEALDIETGAGHEIAQAFHSLRRADQAAGAAAVDVFLTGLLVLLAHGVAAAERATCREFIFLRAALALLEDD